MRPHLPYLRAQIEDFLILYFFIIYMRKLNYWMRDFRGRFFEII